MEYFDVRNIPDGFLRAKFRTASVAETEKLAELFAPVVLALIDKTSPKEKLRIGFKAPKNTGKTTLARRVAECVMNVWPEVNLHGWSNEYCADDKKALLHFDVDAINTARQYPTDNLTMRIQREFQQHDDNYHKTCIHLVEWPEKEKINPNLNVLWQVAKGANGNCEFSLSCIDEISEMDEFKQFLDDAAHLTLAAE